MKTEMFREFGEDRNCSICDNLIAESEPRINILLRDDDQSLNCPRFGQFLRVSRRLRFRRAPVLDRSHPPIAFRSGQNVGLNVTGVVCGSCLESMNAANGKERDSFLDEFSDLINKQVPKQRPINAAEIKLGHPPASDPCACCGDEAVEFFVINANGEQVVCPECASTKVPRKLWDEYQRLNTVRDLL